jgi:GNAT superfamily N-acetyltransferase
MIAPGICVIGSVKHRAEARKLFALVFGGVPRIKRCHVLYGFLVDGAVVAVTAINTGSLEAWYTKTSYACAANGMPKAPEAAISFTAVHPEHRQKGYATELRKHVQSIHKSLVTGTGPHSNQDAMFRLNENTGFKCVWQSGKTTCWYWSRV